jgi:hypothetical protein
MIAQSYPRVWQTLDAWIKTLEGQVIEADAFMQVRQRLAWAEFRRSLVGMNISQGSDRFDPTVQFGIADVQLKMWLESRTHSIIERFIGVCRRYLGLSVPSDAEFRLVAPPSRASFNAVEVLIRIRRLSNGTWDSCAVSETPFEPNPLHVSTKLT